MKFYERIRDFFDLNAGSKYFGRKKQSGGVQLVSGIVIGILGVVYVAANDIDSLSFKLIMMFMYLMLAADFIIRGVHTMKMSEIDPDYVDDIPEMDRDERGLRISHSAAYTAQCVTYFIGLVAGIVLAVCRLPEISAAVLILICVQYFIYDIFRICEEKLS